MTFFFFFLKEKIKSGFSFSGVCQEQALPSLQPQPVVSHPANVAGVPSWRW